MAMHDFVGVMLISFGLPTVLVVSTILFFPLRIITFITSATFWLLSLLFSSILWYAVVPLRTNLAFGVIFSVIFQELSRFLFTLLLHKLYEGIKKLIMENNKEHSQINNDVNADSMDNLDSDNALISQFNQQKQMLQIFNIKTYSYVGGLGFGVMSGLFAAMDFLKVLSGPALISSVNSFSKNQLIPNFAIFYGFQILFLILLHISLGIVMSRAYLKRSPILMVGILVVHLVFSGMTLAPNKTTYGSIILVFMSLVSLVTCLGAFYSVDGRLKRFPKVVTNNIRQWSQRRPLF